MRVVGLHSGHDANICAVEDGKILLHLELERLFNDKNFIGHGKGQGNIVGDTFADVVLPRLGWSEVDYIAFSTTGATHGSGGKPPPTELSPWWAYTEFNPRRIKPGEQFFEYEGTYRGKPQKFVVVNHHMCHMAQSYFTSPFTDAYLFAYDGMGEHGVNTTIGEGKGNKVRHLKDPNDNAIGWCFSVLQEAFAFFHCHLAMVRTAGKAMGLSSYGTPQDKYREAIRELVRKDVSYPDGERHLVYAMRALPGRLGINPQKLTSPVTSETQDLLATLQEESEIYVMEKIQECEHENVCFGGGCALNVQINSLVRAKKNFYAPPACNDGGLSMGACLFVHHNLLDNPFHGMPWNDPYLGMEMANISEAVSRQDVVVTKMPFEELVKKTARLLADGKIVGWLQGRCESGPRALGNRSLLAHPGVPAMKDMINKKIKHREFWRPFAPACLEEEVANWIDIDHPQPYMLEAPLVKEKRRGVIPAVTHVDGTARVQTVNEQQNARFYALIKAFHELTGIPMLLNTSFNDKGFPLCNDAHVAVELLKSTGMDYLVIEDYLIATTEG